MNYDRHLGVILAAFTVAVAVASFFVIVKGLWIGDHSIVIYGLWGILGGIPLGMLVLEGLVAGIYWAIKRFGPLRKSDAVTKVDGPGQPRPSVKGAEPSISVKDATKRSLEAGSRQRPNQSGKRVAWLLRT
jgi:hypothetical protein